MSMESAIAILGSEPVSTPVAAPTSPVQQGTPSVGTPKTLQEVVRPAERPKQPIGADRFAALARKERQIQKQLSDLKTQQSRLTSIEQARKEAAVNPVKALESLGLTYEQITNFILGGNKPTPDLEVKAVRDEVDRLRQEQATRDQAQQEAAKRQAEKEYNDIITDFNGEIKGYIAANKDQYELTSMYQGEEIVYQTIEQHFANSGKIMTIKEASDLVEQYFEGEVRRAQGTKKFQAQPKPEVKGQSQRESVAKQSSPTLSNEMTSSAPSLLPAKTENDRIQRAMAALSK
jgi:hypothetical protein